MRSWIVILFAALVISGCQTADGAMRITSTPVAVSAPTAGAIASDMASRLAEQLPPTAITLNMKSDNSEFAVALEAALKGWGYNLVTDSASKGVKPVELAYALQGIEGQVLAQLSTRSIAIGRAYNTTPSGATPASPLSLMQRN